MSKITITLPDGSKKKVDKGTTAEQIAKGIGEGLARAALVANVNGAPADLWQPIEKDSDLEIITFDSDQGKAVMWHTAAHIFAKALTELYPNAKITIGPPIENGFYYDFDPEGQEFSPAEMEKVEKRMKEIVREGLTSERLELTPKKAKEMFKDNPYKLEIINELPKGEKITAYTMGSDFVDLCRGPHMPNTNKIQAIKLTKLAGAYWRGDSKNKMLTRVYGIAFPQKKQMKEYLTMIEEAEKRDHRKIGQQLDLFSFSDEGPGFPIFHPNGITLWNTILEFWRKEHISAGYKEIRTPIILNQELWKQSGHWDHYRENMYFTQIDEQDYAIKPMNCPGSTLYYRNDKRSYRDLPLRTCEIGLVHRHELSGVLHGLMRVRAFNQDDSHIFVREDQIKEEVKGVVQLFDKFYKLFGLEYHIELSTRPEKSMGSEDLWVKAEGALQEAMDEMKTDYRLNPGDGAFYGPKLDFHLKDSIGRTWQCGTVQLDFQMPERFNLEYTGEDNKTHRPVMIHRVVLGSIERFLGILIEHHAGAFPTWLAPVQAKIISIADRHAHHANLIRDRLAEQGIRAEIDVRQETLEYRIRDAQLKKVPYMLVIGDKEMDKGTVTVRKRNGEVTHSVPVTKFMEQIRKEIDNKK